MVKYSKEFKEQSLLLSDEIGVKMKFIYTYFSLNKKQAINTTKIGLVLCKIPASATTILLIA